MRLLHTEAQRSKIFLGASPPVPLLYPSFLHSIDHEILLTTAQISNFFLGASPQDPLIYPSCLHSIDQDILLTIAQIPNFPWGFAPSSPPLSFLFTFNRPWDTPHYRANTKFFLWALPPDPLITPSCLHPIDQEIQISNSLWGFSPRPLIYPSFLHSINHEITTHWSTYFKNFPGGFLIYPSCLHSIGQEIQISNSLWGFAPSSPPLSFLFTFNRPWDYYTLKHIYQKFSWGHRPQFHSFILPFYIQ